MAESFDLKLKRAETHLEQLNSEATAWVERQSEHIIDEPDPQPRPQQLAHLGAHHRRCRVSQDFSDIPHDFLLLAGDCTHNLRSSLDHLAMALGQANVRSRYTRSMTDKEVQQSEFPIFSKGPMTAKEESARIGCVDPKGQTIIRSLQPHHRGQMYRDHPLWRIHELDRIDKHRRLVLCASRHTGGIGFDFKPGDEPLIKELVGGLRFENYAPVMAVTRGAVLCQYSVALTGTNAEVAMKPFIPLQIAFAKGEPLEFEPLVPLLQSLIEFVRDHVLTQLREFA